MATSAARRNKPATILLMDNIVTSQIIPFDYIVTATSIVGNGSTIVSLVLQQDSSFELEYIRGNCSAQAPSTVDVSGNTDPNYFSVQITDQGTGRQLSNGRIPQNLLMGTAQRGVYEKRSILFPPRATLQFDILNLSASTNTVNIVLHGYKILNQQ
jgi:hypothetical protein